VKKIIGEIGTGWKKYFLDSAFKKGAHQRRVIDSAFEKGAHQRRVIKGGSQLCHRLSENRVPLVRSYLAKRNQYKFPELHPGMRDNELDSLLLSIENEIVIK
jgi:hypothetical protein